MRHILIAVFVLLLCLTFCIWASASVTHEIDAALSMLDTAQSRAESDNAAGAADAVGKAKALWQRREVLFGILMRHSETDEVLNRFAALEQYARIEDRDDFKACCAELSQMLRHLRGMQRFCIENVL